MAGFLGVIAMLLLSSHENLHLVLELLSLTTGSAGVAIADVTIDAYIAQNSISHPLTFRVYAPSVLLLEHY